jgi:hypothetical protein
MFELVNALWFVPPTILMFGTLLLARLVGGLGEAVDELGDQLLRMGEVRRAVVAIRVDADSTRASLDQLRHR